MYDDDDECQDYESLDTVLTPSYIDELINEKLLWTKLSLINVLGDGHCLLYAVCTSMKNQINRDIDIAFLKNAIITESYDNSSKYVSFMSNTQDNELTFKKLMFEYILQKRYNNDFGDVVPYILANILRVGIIIIDDCTNTSRNIPIIIQGCHMNDQWIVVARHNEHYDALRYSTKPSIKLCSHLSNSRDYSKNIHDHSRGNLILPSDTQFKRKKPKPRHVKSDNLSDLKKTFMKHNGLKVAHVNCRSLLPKKDEIYWLVHSTDIDILCITETWLDDAIINEDVYIDGYSIIRKDRNFKRGGGVLMYIKDSINFKERNNINTNDTIEIIWSEIITKGNSPNTLIACVYRPPNADKEYFENMLDTFQKANLEEKEIIILGDFNINYIMDENLHDNPVFLIESLFGLTQLISSPTRVTTTSSSLIDLILTTCPDKHLTSGVYTTSFSDHFLIYSVVKLSTDSRKHKEIRFRNYKNIDLNECLSDFTNRFRETNFKLPSNLDKEEKNAYLENCWKDWKSIFLEISDKHAPFKVSRLKRRTNTWITTDIVKLIYRREYLHKQALKSNDPDKSTLLWQQYRNMRNHVSRTIKKAKSDHFQSISNTTKNQPGKFWKEINKILPKKKNTVDNDILSDDFNHYFSEIGSKVAQNVSNLDPFQHYSSFPNSIHTFEFTEISEDFIAKVLTALPNESKNDILGFDTKLLHLASNAITPSLTQLINMSLIFGYVPIDWKLARVTPAYKGKGNKQEKSNYRPLSVISSLAKLSEKCVQTQLINYLTKYKFVSIDQFAYLKFHSTQTCLHRLIDDILENINESEISAMCFLDIRKCFDTINHKLLLFKLEKYGIRGNELKWFASYLSDRTQVVVNNGSISNKSSLNIGVPQGTILGPILFLMFVNDLSNVVSKCSVNVFADDVVIYTSDTDKDTLQYNLQKEMNAVFHWYDVNKLCLSVEKCSTMVINHNINKVIEDFKIYHGKDTLELVTSMKYLGVVIDNKLKWSQHLHNLNKKVQANNARLRKITNLLPLKSRLDIYNSTSLPIIDYASTVWGHFSKNINHSIRRLEHFAARSITGNFDFINVRGEELMKDLKMSNFENRLKYFHSLLMFKAIHGYVPDHISNHILFSYEVSQRNLRTFDNMDLYKPLPRCELYKRSLAYYGPTQWNILPFSIKDSSSLAMFKTSYKKSFPLHL